MARPTRPRYETIDTRTADDRRAIPTAVGHHRATWEPRGRRIAHGQVHAPDPHSAAIHRAGFVTARPRAHLSAADLSAIEPLPFLKRLRMPPARRGSDTPRVHAGRGG